jgi:hypothetical protein
MKLDSQRVPNRTRIRAFAAAALAAAALAAVPAAGDAAVITVGSNLTKPADVFEAHGADALWWNNTIDGRPGAMPANGQITFVRVKGSVLDSPSQRRNPDPPDPLFHFQVLHPIGGGAVRVMLSSAPFRLPIVTVLRDGSLRGDTQAISGYTPVNLCVHKGDFVDFNEIGGHEWSWPTGGPYDGLHFQVFSRTPSSSTYFYTKSGGTNINSQWVPQALEQGQELLLQAKLATGPNATDFCPGGYMQHVFQGLKLSGASLSGNIVKVRTSCDWKNYGACKGLLTLKSRAGAALGGQAFSVGHGSSSTVSVTLSAANAAIVRRAGLAIATADGHDDPRHDSRAKPDVPVQKKTTQRSLSV